MVITPPAEAPPVEEPPLTVNNARHTSVIYPHFGVQKSYDFLSGLLRLPREAVVSSPPSLRFNTQSAEYVLGQVAAELMSHKPKSVDDCIEDIRQNIVKMMDGGGPPFIYGSIVI